VSTHLAFLLLGLTNGAVFASLAMAVVVVYRSSGVVNFATGGMALYAAYNYAFLRQGKLVMLVPGLPTTVDLPGRLSLAGAVVVAVAMAALLGLLVYLLIFRVLRNAPPVAKAVASLGVTILITGLMVKRLGTSAVAAPPIFRSDRINVGSIGVSADRFWLAGTVVLVALLLWAVSRFTRFGLATRAAAVSEKGAYLSGISPDRLAGINWMIGGAVAGLAGILIAPIVPVVPSAYTLFIVPALAAAILGKFQYLAPAVIGGLATGMLQSEAQYLASKVSWLPQSGVQQLIPLAMILAVLLIRAQPLPTRGALIERNIGRAPRPRSIGLTTVTCMLLSGIALVVTRDVWRGAIVTSLIYAVIALSLVVVTGYGGQISLAQLTSAGVGGFFLGTLTTSWGVPFPLAPIIAALAATMIGVVVGLPALRIRGLPVAVVTLAFAVAVQALWFQNSQFIGGEGKDIAAASFFGIDLSVGRGAEFPRIQFCLMVLVVLTVVAVSVARLRTSRLGAMMLAVRTNERSAAAAGINVVRTKVSAFAIGSFIAGIGGSLLAYKQGNVTWDTFDVIVGLGLFATVYLAGITSVSGGVLAGFLGVSGVVYVAMFQWFEFDLDVYQVITGLGLILTVIMNPEGIVGPAHTLLTRRRSRRSIDASVHRAPIHELDVQEGRADGAIVLSVRQVSVRFGGVVAVNDVSFDVREGQIVGVIGPNGAGKTTLLDAVSGFNEYSGEIVLHGAALDPLKPHERARAGLGRTFQGIDLWNDLTVGENIEVGLATSKETRTAAEADVARVLELLGLTDIRERAAGELSQGERQLVAIARALVGRPSVLLLDEPAGGLDSTESAWLGERLQQIRASGVTIMLIDHDMGLVLNLCDEIQVLNFGSRIAGGTPAAVRHDPAVAVAYLGSLHAEQPEGVA
jgi:ABC-type branched-subunit amino acid transport system ATPase component/branched-subunit amino acid ABC-type transport system permease component